MAKKKYNPQFYECNVLIKYTKNQVYFLLNRFFISKFWAILGLKSQKAKFFSKII